MGCLQGGNSENYVDYSKNDEEKHFRQWESNNGCFRNNFTALYSLLISDERALSNYSVLKATVVRNYNEKFMSIVENPYFQLDGNKNVYHSRKFQSLVFLTTIHVLQVSEGKAYCDKASFLFSSINKDEEIEANFPLERNHTNLLDLLGEFYDISAIVMAEAYTSVAKGREDVYKKLADKENKKDIIEFILNKLFVDAAGKPVNCLSFDDLNSAFMKNKNVSDCYFLIFFLFITVFHFWLFQGKCL